jgi:hypothetical protein
VAVGSGPGHAVVAGALTDPGPPGAPPGEHALGIGLIEQAVRARAVLLLTAVAALMVGSACSPRSDPPGAGSPSSRPRRSARSRPVPPATH